MNGWIIGISSFFILFFLSIIFYALTKARNYRKHHKILNKTENIKKPKKEKEPKINETEKSSLTARIVGKIIMIVIATYVGNIIISTVKPLINEQFINQSTNGINNSTTMLPVLNLMINAMPWMVLTIGVISIIFDVMEIQSPSENEEENEEQEDEEDEQ